MKTRVIVYRQQFPGNLVEFAVPNSRTFLREIHCSPSEFATQHNLKHHSDFDNAVGKSGTTCTLFQAPALFTKPCALLESHEWLSFRDAAARLNPGDDKRFLQLAVQYIAAGGVEDSLLATEYDKEFINNIRSDLEKQWEANKPKEPKT